MTERQKYIASYAIDFLLANADEFDADNVGLDSIEALEKELHEVKEELAEKP